MCGECPSVPGLGSAAGRTAVGDARWFAGMVRSQNLSLGLWEDAAGEELLRKERSAAGWAVISDG